MNFHIPDEYVQQTQFPDNDLGLEGDDDDDGGGTKKDTKWMRQKIERGEVWGKDRSSLSLLLIGSTLLNNTAARLPAKCRGACALATTAFVTIWLLFC